MNFLASVLRSIDIDSLYFKTIFGYVFKTFHLLSSLLFHKVVIRINLSPLEVGFIVDKILFLSAHGDVSIHVNGVIGFTRSVGPWRFVTISFSLVLYCV